MLEKNHPSSEATPAGSVFPMPGWRFAIYVVSVPTLFLGLFFVPFLFFCAWEISLEANHMRDWAVKFKQVRPYYTWEFVTHDGMGLSDTQKGPLKLALHPFSIYSNLPDQRSANFRVNRMGFRGNEVQLVPGPKRRVVLIGGSTAFGTGLDNDGETFSSQLEALLDVEVINAAVIGHGSGQELVSLLTDLVGLQPDLVLTLDGWNDYYLRKELRDPRLLGTNGFEQLESQLITLAGQKDPSLLRRALYLPSLIFPRVSDRLKRSRLGLWTGAWPQQEAQWLPLEAAAETYVTNIINMHKMSNAFIYKFLCVIQPAVGSQEDYGRFRDIVKARLDKAHVPFLDLGETGQIKDSMFLDFVHTDAAGHKTMAEIVAKRIVRDNLLVHGP